MRNIGLDVGFGYTKAMDGTKAILFPSVISPAVELKYKTQLEHPSPYPDHLTVTLDGESHFVGNLALQEGRFAYATLDRVRIETLEYRLLFLTALSLFVRFPDEELFVVTGLPVDDYDDRDLIEKTLSGQFHLNPSHPEDQEIIQWLKSIPRSRRSQKVRECLLNAIRGLTEPQQSSGILKSGSSNNASGMVKNFLGSVAKKTVPGS